MTTRRSGLELSVAAARVTRAITRNARSDCSCCNVFPARAVADADQAVVRALTVQHAGQGVAAIRGPHDLPSEFSTLRRLLEARLSQKNRCAAGKREFVQVLRLMEAFPMATVHAAVKDALRLGAISSDAVRHLVLARVEGRPARLDTGRYPHLPVATVGKTRPADYMALTTGAP